MNANNFIVLIDLFIQLIKPLMKTVKSNTELEALSSQNLELQADYTFHNPASINGPFGTFMLVLGDSETASGTMQINTLFGLGTVTNLTYQGKATSNGSTGYTTIQAKGSGYMVIRPNQRRHVNVDIEMSLKPGFQEGTVNVSGFFTDLPCQATAIHHEIDKAMAASAN